MSDKKLQDLATVKIVEFLHMDLMGPMQVEIIGVKRYVIICVDDLSRYTQVNFIREESDAFDAFK